MSSEKRPPESLSAELPEPELERIHTRTYDVRAYRKSETELLLRGAVRDVKPPGLYIADDPEAMTVHHMVVDLTVEFPDFVITDAASHMLTHPHGECPSVLDDYSKLIGLSIARGYTHKVRELFGGPRGCTHVLALLQAMAPVAVQSAWSMMAGEAGDGTPVPLTLEERRQRMESNRNTCHVWATDGPMFSAMDAGGEPPPPEWIVKRLTELGRDPEEWRMNH